MRYAGLPGREQVRWSAFPPQLHRIAFHSLLFNVGRVLGLQRTPGNW